MNKKSYTDISIERFIRDNAENFKLLDYREITSPGLESHFYDELNKTNVNGFPFASDFADENGNGIDYATYSKLKPEEKAKYRLRYHYLPFMHEMYIGTTGSGKTTTCIEPQLRAISSQKNKPNLFISDPKGEIYSHNIEHLIKNGYKVQVMNFKNVNFSNCWNPLEEIFDKQMKIPDIGKDAKLVKSNTFDKSKLLSIAPLEEFKNGYHFEFDGLAFPSYQMFSQYLASRKFMASAEISSLVHQLCFQLFPHNPYDKDPIWQNGSRDFFNGLIRALLHDALDPKCKFTKDMFNFRTINDAFTLSRYYNDDQPNINANSAKFSKFLLRQDKETCDKIDIIAKSSSQTKRSFLSHCQSMIGQWMSGHIASLTTKTDLSLDDSKQPVAIFIVTRDYDKSDNTIAALLLNWVYRHFLEKAEEAEKKNGLANCRPVHFLLDEFANIPPIPDFDVKIATSRSRNMWFHIYIQSYEQLNNVYEPRVAQIIIDNCNQQTFLGSQSIGTKEKFMKECGQKTVKAIDKNKRIENYPVVALSDLDSVALGWMYIKRIKTNVIYSTFIRSYQCGLEGIFDDFRDHSFAEYAKPNLTNPADKKHQYEEIIPDQFIGVDEKGYLTLEYESNNDYDDDDDGFDFDFKRFAPKRR